MLELKEGMSVVTPGGEEVGRVNRFILDPATNEVTHIVVQKGWLLPEDKVVPFELITSADEGRIVLSEDVGAFDNLLPFEETYFVRATDDQPGDPAPARDPVYPVTPAYYWYPAHTNLGHPGLGYGLFTWPSGETRRNIPDDTIPLKEGTDVISSDGEHVGDIERLFVDPETNKVSHFLISQGALFKDNKLVPVHWVKSVGEDKVHLVVSSRLLERLPAHEQ